MIDFVEMNGALFIFVNNKLIISSSFSKVKSISRLFLYFLYSTQDLNYGLGSTFLYLRSKGIYL